jgi:hypothetical protein
LPDSWLILCPVHFNPVQLIALPQGVRQDRAQIITMALVSMAESLTVVVHICLPFRQDGRTKFGLHYFPNANSSVRHIVNFQKTLLEGSLKSIGLA